ncbi:hypothetical protein [Cardinium endosymbiont of Nabis limbatus]|uniref:hypothetical protein n=1 Tax=Cardinium endosymbiont of Nabis limbatus TaxID=3066217 RepID=UPI003AF35069
MNNKKIFTLCLLILDACNTVSNQNMDSPDPNQPCSLLDYQLRTDLYADSGAFAHLVKAKEAANQAIKPAITGDGMSYIFNAQKLVTLAASHSALAAFYFHIALKLDLDCDTSSHNAVRKASISNVVCKNFDPITMSASNNDHVHSVASLVINAAKHVHIAHNRIACTFNEMVDSNASEVAYNVVDIEKLAIHNNKFKRIELAMEQNYSDSVDIPNSIIDALASDVQDEDADNTDITTYDCIRSKGVIDKSKNNTMHYVSEATRLAKQAIDYADEVIKKANEDKYDTLDLAAALDLIAEAAIGSAQASGLTYMAHISHTHTCDSVLDFAGAEYTYINDTDSNRAVRDNRGMSPEYEENHCKISDQQVSKAIKYASDAAAKVAKATIMIDHISTRRKGKEDFVLY